MVIARKIEQIIEKGGEVKAESKPSKDFVFLSQKVRLDILEQLDIAVHDRPGMSRTAWIQEAIYEKLKRLKDANKD